MSDIAVALAEGRLASASSPYAVVPIGGGPLIFVKIFKPPSVRTTSPRLMWVPAGEEEFAPRQLAKAAAKRATERGCEAEVPWYQARTTTLRLALARERTREQLPESVGRYSKRIDKALPGRHTRAIYDSLKRIEADVLVQLRTGMIRLNSYLRRIGAAESGLCDCGQATETVEHFLFRCKNWTAQREILLKCARTKIGNLSFFLGGKAASDDDKWEPDMQAVRATIRFAMATKRLESTGVAQGVDQ